MQNPLRQTAFTSLGVTSLWARLERTQKSVFVCLMCVHVGVHAGEVNNIRAVKVSRGEAVDGKGTMTAKQTNPRKTFK